MEYRPVEQARLRAHWKKMMNRWRWQNGCILSCTDNFTWDGRLTERERNSKQVANQSEIFCIVTGPALRPVECPCVQYNNASHAWCTFILDAHTRDDSSSHFWTVAIIIAAVSPAPSKRNKGSERSGKRNTNPRKMAFPRIREETKLRCRALPLLRPLPRLRLLLGQEHRGGLGGGAASKVRNGCFLTVREKESIPLIKNVSLSRGNLPK